MLAIYFNISVLFMITDRFANVDGTGRHIVTTVIAHPFAMTIFGDYMYWSEWNLKRIEKAHK